MAMLNNQMVIFGMNSGYLTIYWLGGSNKRSVWGIHSPWKYALLADEFGMSDGSGT